MKPNRFNLPGLLFLLAAALVWELAADWVKNINFPSFHAVVLTLVQDRAELLHQTLITLRRAASGFLIALLLAMPMGLMMGRFKLLRDLVEPVVEFLRPLPPIAVVPLAMVFLGLGDAAKLVVVVYGSAFPILINAMDAVRAQDPMQARLARSLKLSWIERVALVDLPAALPRIMAGVRLSISVALLLTVASELIISSDGLGNYLVQAQSGFQVAAVMAALLVISAVAIAVNASVKRLSDRWLSWSQRRSALVDGAR